MIFDVFVDFFNSIYIGDIIEFNSGVIFYRLYVWLVRDFKGLKVKGICVCVFVC